VIRPAYDPAVQAVLIVNPFSTNVTEQRVRLVEEVLAPELTLLTEHPGHATELAAAAEVEAVVVFGGDGSANEVLNGIGPDRVFGFLPGGGTSVLARALGLPRDPVTAARQLADALEQERTRRISLGRVNGRRFGFGAGIGFTAELVRRVDALGRADDGRRPGDIAYLRTATTFVGSRAARFEPALELSGLGRAAFAVVANCDPYTYLGSLPVHVAPEARFELGLDLVAPVKVGPTDVPRLVRYLFTGRGQIGADDIRYGHDLDRIEVRCDRPLPLQADGEDLGDVEEAVFEAERSAVSVLI
jgi:diacylglycerol kinase family enzyme